MHAWIHAYILSKECNSFTHRLSVPPQCIFLSKIYSDTFIPNIRPWMKDPMYNVDGLTLHRVDDLDVGAVGITVLLWEVTTLEGTTQHTRLVLLTAARTRLATTTWQVSGNNTRQVSGNNNNMTGLRVCLATATLNESQGMSGDNNR